MTEPNPAEEKKVPRLFRKPPGSKGLKGSYYQALAMQRVLFDMAMSEKSSGQDKIAAAKAWTTLEEQKRILKGRPLPGSLKPQTPKSKRGEVIELGPIEQEEQSA